MAAPRRDTHGIVDPAGLLTRVRFRRHQPAEPLRRYVETYWFIDWDLPQPYASQVVPHPSVNVTFQWDGADEEDAPPYGEVTGVALGLYTRKLTGRGRVCGAKFWPGGFRPYAPELPVSHWTGRALPAREVFPQATGDTARSVVSPAEDRDRVAALDAFLLSLTPAPDPQADLVPRQPRFAPSRRPARTLAAPAESPSTSSTRTSGRHAESTHRTPLLDGRTLADAALAMDLVRRIRADRTTRRVGDFAHAEGLSVRALQRLFSAYVGVSPKWIILRYRIHEALELAGTRRDIDWAAVAADLGYADQAHLVRDFTATVGTPPTTYAQAARP